MKYHLVLSCFVAISALLFNTAYSVQVHGIYNVDETQTVYIEKKAFELKCNVSDNTEKAPLTWRREEEVLTDEFKGRNSTQTRGTLHILRVTDSNERDIGNYSCEVGGARAEFQVVTKFFVKVEDNINVVEGEQLKIKCDTRGTPPPRLTWKYKNDTYNITITQSMDRIILNDYKNIKNGELVIKNIEKFERGVYTCIGRPAGAEDLDDDDEDVEKSACTVRVKDKYAALWPFLGICAEVFVLCLIIFIYEKKRNKTELEESDTDQSPDQKNTPDHGKESNLRHRQ